MRENYKSKPRHSYRKERWGTLYVGFAEKVADADDIEREAVATARWGGGGEHQSEATRIAATTATCGQRGAAGNGLRG